MRVYSLASVNVTIVNATKGRVISIGGGGKLIGSIKYAFTNPMFTMETTADGGAVVSHNKSKAGSVDINIRQTSPHIAELSDFLKWCWENPESAESTITIIDTTGNICCQANGVFPAKFPDNEVGQSIGDRTFSFIAAEIIPEETNNSK